METSGEILRSMVTGKQVTFEDVRNNWWELYQRKQASKTGVTNWVAESEQLNREGVPNRYYGSYNRQTMESAIKSGRGVILGFSNAQALRDTVSGKRYDAGVFGHSITVQAYDAGGIWAADPNTPFGTGLVHYTWADILKARPVAMIIPL